MGPRDDEVWIALACQYSVHDWPYCITTQLGDGHQNLLLKRAMICCIPGCPELDDV